MSNWFLYRRVQKLLKMCSSYYRKYREQGCENGRRWIVTKKYRGNAPEREVIMTHAAQKMKLCITSKTQKIQVFKRFWITIEKGAAFNNIPVTIIDSD
jgi:predicted type IV restriction endonuclease